MEPKRVEDSSSVTPIKQLEPVVAARCIILKNEGYCTVSLLKYFTTLFKHNRLMVQSNLQSFLKKKSDYKVTGSLWIECDGERFFGPGRVELLERIEATGSINKAAKEMGMSYKKAWEMVNALNLQAAKPFVITQTGGENGGGSIITEEAKQFIAYHNQLRQRFKKFLEEETQKFNSV